MFVDTLNPIRILRPYIKKWFNNPNARFPFNNRGELDAEGNEITPTVTPYAIPDDIKADPIFEKYKTQEARDRALIDAQKFLGREKLPVPSGPEDKATLDLIFSKLGKPDTTEGYVTPSDMQFEEGFPAIDEEAVKVVKQAAFDSGMLPSQFDKIYRAYMDYSNTLFKNMKTRETEDKQTAETDLRKELGAAYPQTVDLAKKVVLKFADENAWNTLDGGLGNNPAMVKMLSNIGKLLSEHQLVGEPAGLSLTPEQAQSELNKIRGDLKGPFHDAQHPQHQEMVERVSQLTKLTLVGKTE